jgi:hypothetical protein
MYQEEGEESPGKRSGLHGTSDSGHQRGTTGARTCGEFANFFQGGRRGSILSQDSLYQFD